MKILNITRNTSYLTLALIIQKIISFLYFILITRYLGLDLLGQFYTAIAFTTILALIMDLGLNNVLIREVAKKKEVANIWLRSVLSLKLLLALLSLVVALSLVFFLNYEPLIIKLIMISFFSMFFDSLSNTFLSVIRAFHNLKYESISAVLFQTIVLILALIYFTNENGVLWLMSAMASAAFLVLVFSSYVARVKFKLKILPKFNFNLTKKILALSWPFAVYNILQRFYTYFDSLLLGFLASYFQVGLYQIAFKIIFALQFLPLAFIASLYPAMSAYWQDNRDQLAISFRRAFNYLIIISLPIIFGVIILAPEIIELFKVDSLAIIPLRIIIIALLFIFLNFPIGSLLNACDRQKTNTLNMAITTVFSISLNLILIPLYQALGASITVLLSTGLMFILGLRASFKLIDYRLKYSFSIFLKSLLSSFLMLSFIYLSLDFFALLISVVLGALVYFSSLYLFKGYSKEDVLSLIKVFKKV